MIWVICIGAIIAIIACIRCNRCPLHQWLFLGKCWEKRRQIEAGKLAKSSVVSLRAHQQERIATFEDVVLVRSLSHGKG